MGFSWRLREGQLLAQGHPAKEWQSQNWSTDDTRGKGRVWGTFWVTNEAGPPGDVECPRFTLGLGDGTSLSVPHPPTPRLPQGGLRIPLAPPTDWSLGPRVQACAAPTRGPHNPMKWTIYQSCIAPCASTLTPCCLWGREGWALLGASAFHKGNSRPREGHAWPEVTQRTIQGRDRTSVHLPVWGFAGQSGCWTTTRPLQGNSAPPHPTPS